MRRLFLLSVLCGGIVSFCISQQTPWEWVNPLPQGNPLNGIWATTKDSAVAVGAYGTIVRTSNGGLTWQVEPTSGGITTQLFATQFISSSTGWATGEGGVVLKTIDGGAGWSTYFAPTFSDMYAVYFVSDLIGWVAGNSGQIFKTTDGGISWASQTSGTPYSLYSIYFSSPVTGWMVGSSGKILKTTNGGTTWAPQVSGTSQSLFSVNFISASVGWAVGVSGTILNTVNGGTTWVPQSSGSLTSFFGVHFVSPTIGWIIGAYGTILKTSDGGINWFQEETPTYNDLFAIRFVSDTQGWVVGDFGTTLATTNGGASWISQSTGPKTELYAMHFPTITNGYVVGDQGTILRTTNSGNSWNILNSGLYQPMYGVKFVTSTLGWVVGDSAVILKTTNGGGTWTEQNSHTDVTIYSVEFASPTIGWVVGDGGTILKTVNGGTTWAPESSHTNASLLKVRFFNTNLGWVAGDGGVILKTTNGGTTWTTQASGTYEPLYSIYFADNHTGYASGDFGTIVATTDAGTTWNPQTTNTDVSLYGVTFSSPLVGWAIGDDGTLIGTGDGGTTWNLQSTGTVNTLYETQFVKGSTGGVVFAAGIGGTIICSGITPLPVRTWVGSIDSLWYTAGNWFPLGVPEKLDSVIIPATSISPVIRQITQQINIAALNIASGGKLTIGPELAQLVVKDNVEVNGIMEIDSNASIEIVLGGGFLVGNTGTFVPGQSTIAFTNQGKLTGSFNSVIVNEGATVQTLGNVQIKNRLLNLSNFLLRSTDTLAIENPDPFAFWGGGFTGAGTIKRAIMPGSTQPYRFESPVTFLRFRPTGTLPNTIWMTAYPNTLPPEQNDSLFVRRYYSIYAKGGNNYTALMSLRYDTSETSISVDQLSIFQDSSKVITNMGQTDFLDSDLVAIYLDSVHNLSTNWDIGLIDYLPKHPYTFTDSLYIKDNGTGSNTLVFGAIPGATDGIDTIWGESQLAPKPPVGTFDARWAIPLSRGSATDILDVFRGSRIQNVYTCELQPSGAGYPITLQWNRNALIVGSYFLRDSSATPGGQFNVNMKLQNSFIISSSSIKVVQIVHSIPYYYAFKRRWNLISLPLTSTTDRLKTSIFPTATSPTYKFAGGYLTEDTLKNGRGYWLKFPTSQTVVIEGFARHLDTINVNSGWNMIGSISYPVAVRDIIQNPSNIITGNSYSYSNGYLIADSIRPAAGYWIKVTQAGKLILSSTGFIAKQSTPSPSFDQDNQLNILTITDNEGNHQTLYFGKTGAPSFSVDSYEMPPPPPEGIFDARFSSNAMAEEWSGQPQVSNIQIHSAKFPITIHWHLTQPEVSSLMFSDAITGKPIGSLLTGADGNVRVLNPAITSIHMEVSATQLVPKEFLLRQNYPNPFNPFTTIEFELPVPSTITLRIFNILGQQIATLADNRQYNAGTHVLNFDGSNLGSGIYFYQLMARGNSTKAFQQVRKMLLLK